MKICYDKQKQQLLDDQKQYQDQNISMIDMKSSFLNGSFDLQENINTY